MILAAPAAASRYFDAARLQEFLAVRGIAADVQTLTETGDVASVLVKAAMAIEANLLVSGAFGHPRLQEFIFGGTTRSLLNAAPGSPSLFLSH